MAREEKPCILYSDRPVCIGCGDCRCELDPDKICDNCMRCVEDGPAFRSVMISGVLVDAPDGTARKSGDTPEQERTPD